MTLTPDQITEHQAELEAFALAVSIARFLDTPNGASRVARQLKARGWVCLPPPASLRAAGGARKRRKGGK